MRVALKVAVYWMKAAGHRRDVMAGTGMSCWPTTVVSHAFCYETEARIAPLTFTEPCHTRQRT